MKILSLLICLFLLTGCTGNEPSVTEAVSDSLPVQTESLPPETTVATTVPTEAPDPIGDRIDQMSLEERVGQLFLARCSAPTAIPDIRQYHLGGFVLFGVDIRDETPDSLREKLESYQGAADIPLLIAVDEEGGTVTRVSRYPAFRETNFASPRDLYSWGGMEWVLAVEAEKCDLLGSLGINVNLGPVCDISTDPAAFMYKRSLGLDAYGTADFVSQTVDIMNTHQIGSALKHFPGYGNNSDTHTGIAVDMRSLDELEGTDLIPFLAGIQADCGSIMVSHTIVACMDPEFPASLSPIVHHYIRDEMGFGGVIVTDDLVMQAITDQYGAGEAAVLAVLAGNDLLCSSEYAVQYEAVLAAVLEGRIDVDTLNRAVRNVLQWKQALGLL